MTFLTIVIFAFLLLEIANAYILFFKPDSRQVHGMGMFPAWEKSKNDPAIHNLMKYLITWVAGSKLILATLLIVILIWGDQQLVSIAGFALVISMSPFYFGLFPAMKKIDDNDQVLPKGFSLHLGFTITMLILMLLIGSIITSLSLR